MEICGIEETIKILDKFITEHKLFNIKHSDGLEQAIETLLTAYEKEKEKNKELSDKLTEKICKGVEEEILEEYRQTIISKDKEIEELKKENLEIRDWKYVIDSPIDLEKLKELDLIKIKGKEYISKDKIKAKIEELENEKEKYFEKQVIQHEIEILHSLLEKE